MHVRLKQTRDKLEVTQIREQSHLIEHKVQSNKKAKRIGMTNPEKTVITTY